MNAQKAVKIAIRSEEFLRCPGPKGWWFVGTENGQAPSPIRHPSTANGDSRDPIRTNEAGMSMKTKESREKAQRDPGMCMKTKVLKSTKRECC